jgi:hypothetical protein
MNGNDGSEVFWGLDFFTPTSPPTFVNESLKLRLRISFAPCDASRGVPALATLAVDKRQLAA